MAPVANAIRTHSGGLSQTVSYLALESDDEYPHAKFIRTNIMAAMTCLDIPLSNVTQTTHDSKIKTNGKFSSATPRRSRRVTHEYENHFESSHCSSC